MYWLDSVVILMVVMVGDGSGCMVFFFFKQKTAYEMLRSLVGSEMCIRDRYAGRDVLPLWVADMDFAAPPAVVDALQQRIAHGAVSYTHLTLPTIYSV